MIKWNADNQVGDIAEKLIMMPRVLHSTLVTIFLGIALVPADMARATVLINFDDMPAPGLFSDQVVLAEQYASLGIHFIGTGEVLNSSSNFGVPLSAPFTAPNFLAFNSGALAFPPETMQFDFPISALSLDFAGEPSLGAFTISLDGYLNSALIDTASLLYTSGPWQSLTLDGAIYDQVVFNVSRNDGFFVVDNLSFTPTAAAVPEPSSWMIHFTFFAGAFFSRRRCGASRISIST